LTQGVSGQEETLGIRKVKSTQTVDELLAGLEHPLRADIEELRGVVRSASDGIGEEVKWNSPSFHTGEHFATMRLHGKVPLQLILHLGAKKAVPDPGAVQDPEGLLRWLGPDRACIDFMAPGEVGRRADALKAILRQWVRHVPVRAAG
jgi:hypothetical protein